MPSTADRPLDIEPLTASQRLRRTAVTRAVLDLLEGLPSEQIQMREVSARSGVALATVYRYFPTKEQLLAAAMAAWNDHHVERFKKRRAAIDFSTPAAERALVLASANLGVYRHRPHHARLEIELHASADPYVIETLEQRAVNNRATLFELIPDVSPDVARVASLAIGGTLFTALALWTTGRISFARAQANITDVVRLTLAPRLTT
ncbi:TetR/AcrR family transcriptional regulator [Nocardioides daejeonensis]|uniref:TetR/AcrR family transcriptional regulator n=1 Tax=Nocardioides daejeonensis TaxID=1046556 RepID=UPI000D74DA5A|nr:TetR family transcriptional regulator [Nocardioides daejeonensis]